MTKLISGSGGGGGGKGGGGGGSAPSSRTPSVASDSLDSKQYATVVDLISEGEIQGLKDGFKSIYFENTPLQNADGTYNFQDVTIATRNGTQNQSYFGLTPDVQDEKPVNVEVQFGTPVTRQITDTNVNAVRVTITVPQLQQNVKNGDVTGQSVELEIQVQYNGGGFTRVIYDMISGRTSDAYQKDYIVNLNAGFTTADIRVIRISVPDSTIVANDPNVIESVSRFQWTSYTEIIYAKLRYPNSALIALRVNAEQFNSIPSRSYLIRGIKVQIPSNATVDNATGRLIYSGIWNGTFAAAQWCSDPAWILWDLLTSTRYGFGNHIQAAQLDKFAFYAASQYSSALVPDGFGGLEPRFSCNVNIQTAEEAYKLINDMCSVFRVMPYWSTGALTISQDKPQDYSYYFSPANVTEGGFSYQGGSRKNRPTVCVVSYLDLNTRDTAYEVVEDADGIAKYGVVKTEISAFACTSRGQAYRIGEWLLYSERYESEIVSFTASVEAGVLVRPGSLIKIADPVKAGERRGGRIVSATTTTVTVDSAAGLTSPGTLNVILPDGTAQERTVTGLTGNTFTVGTAFTTAPNNNSIWLYGNSTIVTTLWRVLTVQEQDGANYAISAISYDPTKYDYIERGTPLQPRDITNLNIIASAPINLRATEVLYEDGGIAKAKIVASWEPVLGVSTYQVQWRRGSNNWTTATVYRPDYEILDSTVGTYEVRVYSQNANLRWSPQPAVVTYQAVGKTAAPETPTGISLVPNSEATALLSWNRALALDVLLGGKVLIRHSNALSGATWDGAQTIVAAAAGSQTQKQVPLLEGTYLIKFEDDTGNRSEAASVVADLPTPQDRLLVENHFEDTNYQVLVDEMGTWDSLGNIDEITLNFPGTKTNMTFDAGLGALILTDPTLLTGEYIFKDTVNLGGVFDVNLRRNLVTAGYLPSTLWDSLTGLIDEWTDIDGGSVDGVDALMYVRTTKDNPAGSPTWGAWNEMTNALVRARGLQFKIVVTTELPSQNIRVSELGYVMELQQRVEQSGVLNSSGGGPLSITFNQAFYEEPAIGVTAYAQSADDSLDVTEVTRTGFKLEFKQAGTPVSRTFTYTAVGYGKEII